MLHACFVRSPFPARAIRAVDSAAAERVPGVRHVFTALDLNGDVHEQWHRDQGPDAPDTPRPPLAEGEVRFVGDPVAVVVADTRSLAEDACRTGRGRLRAAAGRARLRRRPRTRTSSSSRRTARTSSARSPTPRASALDVSVRSGARRDAPRSTSRRTPRSPWKVVASSSTSREHRRVHDLRGDAGAARGAAHVRASPRPAGAPHPGDHARHGRRVRTEGARPARGDGPDARRAEGRRAGEVGGGPAGEPDRGGPVPPRAGGRDDGVRRRRPHPGRADRLSRRLRCVPDAVADELERTARGNPLPRSLQGAEGGVLGEGRVHEHGRPDRVPGTWQFESLAREVLLDIAARRMGVDPVELRRRNLLQRRRPSLHERQRHAYDAVTPLETLERALELLDYEVFRREQASARRQGRHLGVGCRRMSSRRRPAAATSAPRRRRSASSPRVTSTSTSRVDRQGTASKPPSCSSTADALGVDLDDVSTIQGDTALTGFSAGTAGSRSAGMTAGAIRRTPGSSAADRRPGRARARTFCR